MGEWCTLLDALEEHGKLVHVTTHGRTYDPRNGRDRRTLLEDAVDSEYESYKVHTRTSRTAASHAADGRPTGRAPYGYVPVHDTRTGRLVDWVADTTEAIPGLSRADVVRELFRRIKAGHAMGAIARDVKARGIRNGSGRPFVPQHLRSMVVKPAYAGIRSHHGTERPGTWKGLVSEADYRAVVRMLNTRTQAQKRRPDGRAQHELTRINRCGKCGGPMRAVQVKGVPSYECREHGCVRVPRARIDEYLIGTGERPYRSTPMPISPDAARLRARIAGRKSHNPNADVTDEQRELKALTLEERIRLVVESAPSLNPEQIERLRALLPAVE